MAVGKEEREAAIAELMQTGCSCVVCNGNGTRRFHRKGVIDLYELLMESPAELHGAFIADKVVGKGAAALMVLGGIVRVWTAVISHPALELLERGGVVVEHAEVVPNILNRAGTGICPVEELCACASTAEECLPLIRQFIENNKSKQGNDGSNGKTSFL